MQMSPRELSLTKIWSNGTYTSAYSLPDSRFPDLHPRQSMGNGLRQAGTVSVDLRSESTTLIFGGCML